MAFSTAVHGVVTGTYGGFAIQLDDGDDARAMMKKIARQTKLEAFELHVAPANNTTGWSSELQNSIALLWMGDKSTVERIANAESKFDEFGTLSERISKDYASFIQLLVVPTKARAVEHKPETWCQQAWLFVTARLTAICSWAGLLPQQMSFACISLASTAWAAHIVATASVDAVVCNALTVAVMLSISFVVLMDNPYPMLVPLLLIPGTVAAYGTLVECTGLYRPATAVALMAFMKAVNKAAVAIDLIQKK